MAYLAVNQTGSGPLVAAVPGVKIVLESYMLCAGGASTCKFVSQPASGATTDLTGDLIIAANGNINLDSVQMGIGVTNVGEGLSLTITGAAKVTGHIRYSERG